MSEKVTFSAIGSSGDTAPRPYDTAYGKKICYTVRLEGKGNENFEISRNHDSEPPKKGETIEVTFEDQGEYPTKLKRVFAEGGFKSGGGKKGGGRTADPEREQRITWLACMKSAVDAGAKTPKAVAEIADGLYAEAAERFGLPPIKFTSDASIGFEEQSELLPEVQPVATADDASDLPF